MVATVAVMLLVGCGKLRRCTRKMCRWIGEGLIIIIIFATVIKLMGV